MDFSCSAVVGFPKCLAPTANLLFTPLELLNKHLPNHKQIFFSSDILNKYKHTDSLLLEGNFHWSRGGNTFPDLLGSSMTMGYSEEKHILSKVIYILEYTAS